MKYIFIIVSIGLIASILNQKEPLPDARPYFTAIIVEEIDTSVKWYTEKLGFKLLDRMDSEERGFKQVNLTSKFGLIELLELNNVLKLSEVLKDAPEGSMTTGIFKFGFKVSDFDHVINHLTEMKTEFHGSVVQTKDSDKRMVIVKDPDGNRIQLFEE